MRFIYFVFLLSCCCTLNAQSYLTKKTATGKALKWYTSAKADAYHKEYEAATKTLNKLLTSFPDFIDAQLLLAQIQFDQQQYAEAAANFERTLAIDPNYNARIYYMLGVNEWKRDEFERSAQFLGQYIERKPRNVERLKRAKRMLANAEFAAKAIKNPVPYMPKPLASTINTTRPEYAAAFTADEQMLIFTRRILEQNGPRTYVHEDFYISQKDANGNWQTAQAWQSINTPQNEGGHSISADGKLLVFTACDYKSSVGGCDIYFVEQTASGQWTRPQSVGENINTRAAEALPTLSADGKTMIFASNRNGTFGQKDLWISYRQDDGKWKTPENLGDKVNTPFKEDAPFLHPDGKTLYFMSNGHPGMGGSDLYFSKLQADGTWDTPINLGYPINTKGDEGALSLSFDGEIAYFARDKQQAAEGNVRERDIDIFTFEMPTNARPEAITYVQANVRDASTKQLLSAVEVQFTRLSTGKIHHTATTGNDGAFLTVLPSQEDYALRVHKQGYIFHSEHFALAKGVPNKAFELDIYLNPIEETITKDSPKKAVILKNVFFDTASAKLLAPSQGELNQLANLLKENPALRIQINGHTDNVGQAQANQQLSRARAKAVYDYLMQQGIAASRLQYEGFGADQPLASNTTPDGRQKNRRTEFVVLSR